MTIGPDDLPPDPFLEGAAMQVVCPCARDGFHLVLDGAVARVLCSGCGQTQAVFPRAADTGPHRGWPQHPGVTGERDMLPPPQPATGFTPTMPGTWSYNPRSGIVTHHESGVEVQAGWDTAVPALQPPREGTPPPLRPAYPPEQCNIFLDGGPYHGQATWVMPDCTSLVIHGYGVYTDTSRAAATPEGRSLRVFTWG